MVQLSQCNRKYLGTAANGEQYVATKKPFSFLCFFAADIGLGVAASASTLVSRASIRTLLLPSLASASGTGGGGAILPGPVLSPGCQHRHGDSRRGRSRSGWTRIGSLPGQQSRALKSSTLISGRMPLPLNAAVKFDRRQRVAWRSPRQSPHLFESDDT